MAADGEYDAWLLTCSADDQWRVWDDELVIRLSASGDTHHLGPLATGIFQLFGLQNSALAAADITATLARISAEEPGALAGPIEHALQELERIGVVRANGSGAAA